MVARPQGSETPIERLRRIVAEVRHDHDLLVLSGFRWPRDGEPLEDVRARVAERSGRPILTLVKGGWDDAR